MLKKRMCVSSQILGIFVLKSLADKEAVCIPFGSEGSVFSSCSFLSVLVESLKENYSYLGQYRCLVHIFQRNSTANQNRKRPG